MNTVRTRFAPSPTGYMHIGNLRTALYGYLFSRNSDGSFVLRIEDTDQQRIVADAAAVIYRTLKLAGLQHDEGPDCGGAYGPYIQSERRSIYKEYAEELIARGAAYRCFCKKDDESTKSEEGYNRKCRTLQDAVVQQYLAEGKPYVVRQRMPTSGTTQYDDIVFGTIEIENRLLDDQILLKSDGMPTYNFANVVDDHLMRISHVMRGSEYISSTPKYVLLYEAFGWEVPQFVHLPLIMGRNDDGTITKLSKRHGAVGFEQLVQDEGYLPQAVVNYIALLGWSPKDDREIFTLSELVEAFSLEGLNKSAAVFDYQKLKWVNGEHIKAMPFNEFCVVALPFASLSDSPLCGKWREIAALLHQRVHVLSDIPDMIAFMHAVPPYDTELYVNKKNRTTRESSLSVLTKALELFSALPTWDAEMLHSACATLANDCGMKFGAVMWSLRIALSGQLVTCGGALEIMTILGREESLKRLATGVEVLRA